MKNFTAWIEEKIVPVISKVTNTKYFLALRAGFMAIMPLTIIGSFFLLVTDFPLPGYPEFMANLFGENWTIYVESAYRSTFNMMGFFLAGTMAYKLAEQYELDKLSSLILSLVSYVSQWRN